MAVKILYQGKLRNVNLVDNLVAEVQEICEINNWLPDTQLRPFSNPFPILRGISFKIDKSTDSLDLYFNKYGILFPSLVPSMNEREHNTMKFVTVKSQFWGLEGHIKLINLLTYLGKTYFETFEIDDKGDYYPSYNREKLNERFKKGRETILFIKDIIESEKFQGQFIKPPSTSELVPHLQKAVDKALRNTGKKMTITLDHIFDVVSYTNMQNRYKKK